MHPNRSLFACVALLGLAPVAALAHPHEFIDTTLTLRFDAGGDLAAVRFVWAWDDFTSMLILADQGMDGDGDGVLSDAETAALTDLYSHWPPEFDGHFYLRQGADTVALAGPQGVQAAYRDGQLIVSFERALVAPVAADSLTLQVYDPSYYSFYALTGAPVIEGRSDCRIATQTPDVEAAQQLYEQAMGSLTEADLMSGANEPQVGGAFADTVSITCAAQP